MSAPNQENQGLFGMSPQGGLGNAPDPGTQYQSMTQPAPAAQVAQTDTPVDRMDDFEDYWGFEETHEFVLPDGKQTITFKTMTEGDVAQYNKSLKRDVVVEKRTGDARFRIDQSEERKALIMAAVTGWTLMRRGRQGWERATFSTGSPGSELAKWIDKANPMLINELEKAIRDRNPFLTQGGTETIEAIDRQIEELTKQRQEMVDRERGEGSSAAR